MNELIEAIRTYLHRVAGYDPFVVTVELLLIGLVVWSVMRFLRGTRGARLIKGVALLLATFYVVILMLPKELGWQRVQFLYGHFLFFAFAAVVVAFQPELRRGFIQIGQARFLRTARGEVATIVDALVESASYLSRNKIGAVLAV